MPSLKLAVLGSGLGESIVVVLPNARVLVVDCYDAVRVSQYLDNLAPLQVSHACLTHPHLDHCLGFAELLSLNRHGSGVEQFWRPPVPSLTECRKRAAIQEARLHKSGAVTAEEYRELGAALERLILAVSGIRTARLQAGRNFEIVGLRTGFPVLSESIQEKDGALVPLEIVALTPSGKDVENRMDALASGAFQNAPQRELSRGNNLHSVALVIRYGETRVVLGADTEKASWREARQSSFWPRPPTSGPVALVKASHHLSAGAYVPELYVEWRPSTPLRMQVVATRNSSRLPDLETQRDLGTWADVHVVGDSILRPSPTPPGDLQMSCLALKPTPTFAPTWVEFELDSRGSLMFPPRRWQP